MKTFSFQNGVFRCDVERRGQLGHVEYDFNLGVLSASKPSGIPSFVWLNFVVNFLRIALKFVQPINEE